MIVLCVPYLKIIVSISDTQNFSLQRGLNFQISYLANVNMVIFGSL